MLKIREAELKKTMSTIDSVLRNIPASKEPAWKAIREFREER